MKRKLSDDKTPLRTVLVGCGRMGKNHLRVLQSDPRFNVVAVVDSNPKRLSPDITVKRLKNIGELSSVDYDCAVLATPTVSHYEHGLELCKLGRPFLMEKPVCTSGADARKLLKAVKKHKARVAVGHVERSNPVVSKLQQILESGGLGRPIHFSFTRIGGYPENIHQGDNVLIDLAVHDIDIMQYLCGEVEVISAILHSTRSPGVFDTAEILLQSKAGPSASIHVNWVTPTKVRTLRVTATRGVGFLDYMLQTCTVFGGALLGKRREPELEFSHLVKAYQDSDRIEFGVRKEEPLKIQLDNFYRFIRKESNNCCSIGEAVRVLELAEQALRYAKDGK